MAYRELSLDEIQRIREINTSKFIATAWRDIEGVHLLVEHLVMYCEIKCLFR